MTPVVGKFIVFTYVLIPGAEEEKAGAGIKLRDGRQGREWRGCVVGPGRGGQERVRVGASHES